MEYETLGLLGIDVLEFYYMDLMEEGAQYSDVKFSLESLKKYNGRIVCVMNDWKVIIYDEEGIVEETEFYIIENNEFREMLYKKYPLK